MKQSSLTAKLLKARKAAQRGSPDGRQTPPGMPEKGWTRWKWSLTLLIITLTAVSSYYVLYFVVLSRIPHVMVGTWVVMDVKTGAGDKSNQALKDGRLVFRRDGTLTVMTNMDGKGYTIKATVEVEDETLRITSVNPSNGQKATDVQTIRLLEKDRFVIEDSQGTTLMMERLRE